MLEVRNHRAWYAGAKARGTKRSAARSAKTGGGPVLVKVLHHKGVVGGLRRYVCDAERLGEGQVYGALGEATVTGALRRQVLDWDQEALHEGGRTAAHIVFSVREAPSEESRRALCQAVARVQQSHFSDQGYDSFYAIHCNTDHAHAHLVVRTRNLVTQRKLRCSRAMVHQLKRDYALYLRQQGLVYEVGRGKERGKERGRDAGLLKRAEQELGAAGREMVKKALIGQAQGKDAARQKKATARLELFRKAVFEKEPQARAQWDQEQGLYAQGLRKGHLKKELGKLIGGDQTELVGRYVDWLWAMERRVTGEARSADAGRMRNFAWVETLTAERNAKELKLRLERFAQYFSQGKTRQESGQARQTRQIGQGQTLQKNRQNGQTRRGTQVITKGI